MIPGLGVKLMRRRDFITLLGGGVVAWPLAARGQQGERLRLVGVLEGISAGTSNANARTTAFLERLQQSGWTPGRNVRLEVRWGGGDQAAIRKHAAELVALAPDVIVAGGGATTEVMLKQANEFRCMLSYCGLIASAPAHLSNSHHSRRVCHRSGPCGVWLRPEPVETRGQRHLIYDV